MEGYFLEISSFHLRSRRPGVGENRWKPDIKIHGWKQKPIMCSMWHVEKYFAKWIGISSQSSRKLKQRVAFSDCLHGCHHDRAITSLGVAKQCCSWFGKFCLWHWSYFLRHSRCWQLKIECVLVSKIAALSASLSNFILHSALHRNLHSHRAVRSS